MSTEPREALGRRPLGAAVGLGYDQSQETVTTCFVGIGALAVSRKASRGSKWGDRAVVLLLPTGPPVFEPGTAAKPGLETLRLPGYSLPFAELGCGFESATILSSSRTLAKWAAPAVFM